MINNIKHWALSLLALFVMTTAFGQNEPNPHDFGKMWTFENPPTEWFKKAYNYDLDQEWFDEARNSSLRFASWCSASFVSPNGLVLTNHHCSESVVSELQEEGENFTDNGFFAATLGDERRNPEVFVEQLIKVADVTDRMTNLIGTDVTDENLQNKTREAMQTVIEEFTTKPGWENLRLQPVPYYNGAKYSLYGYKRYDDVRLVFLPEAQLGFFGGDPDNFTYPRYNLDCTFWRVYDDNGQPLNTTNNYFKFNLDGVKENTPVFVIGNPGSTERYRTVAQLEYDRDYRYPIEVEIYNNRIIALEAEYKQNPTHETNSTLLGLSNQLKSTKGTLDGLNNPALFNRKVEMEKKIKTSASNKSYWDDMATYYAELSKHTAELMFIPPSSRSGVKALMFEINDYSTKLAENPENPELDGMEKKLIASVSIVNDPKEIAEFSLLLTALKKYSQADDEYLTIILDGRTPDVAAKEILSKSVFANEKLLTKILNKNPKKFLKSNDQFIEASELLAKEATIARDAFVSTGAERRQLGAKVAGEAFKVFGDNLPPDATFTLRISDGVVRSYNYNGTVAPIKTTYYGMYDRYASNDGVWPWSLPDRWLNPPMDLLKAPMNFISTADIVGGNSGSPIINVKKEIVGLAFDGNIESLPGKFIYDDKENRTVAVHAGGIVAALRYIYKADRLVAELIGQ